jgi:hypothetical protein
MTTVASSWWPFGRGSTAAQSANAKKSKIRNLQRQAFINQNKLPDDETTKKIYDYIEELRSIRTLTFKNISFANIPEMLNLYKYNIRNAATLINLVKDQALLNPVYGPICCKEIQKSVIDAKFKNSSLGDLVIWFASEKIRTLTELALLNNSLASLALPLFQDPNIILKSADTVDCAEIALRNIQAKWAPQIILPESMYYTRAAFGVPTDLTFKFISHTAQKLIIALDPVSSGKEDERSSSDSLRPAYTHSNLTADVVSEATRNCITKLRSIKEVIFKDISFANIPEMLNLYNESITKAVSFIDTLRDQTLRNPSYGPICCQEIQQSVIDAKFRNSDLIENLLWFAVQKIHVLTQLALSDKNLASLALPLFKDPNLIWKHVVIEKTAETSLQNIQRKWAPEITLTKPMHYMRDEQREATCDTSQLISHMAQQLIDALDPLWFAKKHPARNAFMSASLRLANNSKLKVDDRAGHGKFVPDTSTAAGTSGGASAAAPAITDDSDDEGDGEGAGTLNGSHPGAVAGAYDDMPALEFVGSDDEGDGEGADPEESKGGEE